mmetsp:Transcript_5081/g.5703  ORF Transcript_5081/g.5703 Transcript_5081/m.5703 type:complete len:122 (+) Transcript_5081:3-368(+)
MRGPKLCYFIIRFLRQKGRLSKKRAAEMGFLTVKVNDMRNGIQNKTYNLPSELTVSQLVTELKEDFDNIDRCQMTIGKKVYSSEIDKHLIGLYQTQPCVPNKLKLTVRIMPRVLGGRKSLV